MTKNFGAVLIAIAALTCASGARASGPEVKRGLWKFTETAQGRDTAVPRRRFTHCLTPNDVEDFGKTIAGADGPRVTARVNCRLTAFSESSTSVNWTYECTGERTFTNVNSITFDSPSHYTGIKKMNGAVVSLAIEGTRIGDCVGGKGGAR